MPLVIGPPRIDRFRDCRVLRILCGSCGLAALLIKLCFTSKHAHIETDSAPPSQQPLQIEPSAFSTLASSWSTAGLVPSSGPFMGRPMPDDESAVPAELVPGVKGLVPKAPPAPTCDAPPIM